MSLESVAPGKTDIVKRLNIAECLTTKIIAFVPRALHKHFTYGSWVPPICRNRSTQNYSFEQERLLPWALVYRTWKTETTKMRIYTNQGSECAISLRENKYFKCEPNSNGDLRSSGIAPNENDCNAHKFNNEDCIKEPLAYAVIDTLQHWTTSGEDSVQGRLDRFSVAFTQKREDSNRCIFSFIRKTIIRLTNDY